MFGGLTKTSSRIAIAAAFGLLLGGFAFKATPAMAADLGGDCCADLEERVAELEATTVRKGNKKVSVTLSGWVVKSMNYWDDGDESHFVVGDKDYDLGSRFAITGSATIAPGWSAGYNLTINAHGDIFGFGANQVDDLAGTYGNISTLYSYIYIKSDTLGTLNWGHLSPASDNPAVLADLSGTVIESNSVFFEGPGFFLRAKGNGGTSLAGATWGNFLTCQGLGAGIGTDCWGAAQPAVRYDSPTWGGFRFEASYGKNQLTGPFVSANDEDFWDVAAFYTADWNSIKLSAAAAYTWIETGVVTGEEVDLFQAGASIMHKPSGLGIYGMGQWESSDGSQTSPLGILATTTFGPPTVTADFPGGGAPIFDPNITTTFSPSFSASVTQNNQDTDAWYVKPFWRKTWGAMNGVGLGALGATTFYGEFGQYNDQFVAGSNLCLSGFGLGTNVGNFCNVGPAPGVGEGVFVTGSEVQRYGLGVVQEIDSAAMHVWLRWQHQEIDVDLVGFNLALPGEQDCTSGCKINQGFDDWDLFQVGGVIFF